MTLTVDTRPVPGSHRKHGDRARYVHGPDENDQPGKGCRCDSCRDAIAIYERERKRRTTPAYVAAGPARAHVEWLGTQGVGLKQVAKVSGVAHGTLWKLMYGKDGRPSRRVRHSTAERLLAVTPSAGAGGSRVPAGPVWADVEKLLARGWAKSAIAKAVGQTGPGLQLGTEVVTRRNAQAVRALLDEPVPPRRSRWGVHPVPQPEPEPDPQPELDDTDRLTLQLAELLEQRIDENQWRRRAACITAPKWMFFPARGDAKTIRAAKAMCATCPVRAECLDANLMQKAGVWGGTTERERRQIRLRTEAAA